MTKLSVIIPCFNEEKTIMEIIRQVFDVKLIGNVQKEIIVIDDKSTDNTSAILSEIKEKYELIIIENTVNSGKGVSLRKGFAKSTGDYVIVQDADLEYDPEDYNKLILPVLNHRAVFVFGSRFIGGSYLNTLNTLQVIGNKFMTWLSNILSGKYLTDIHTCYILMPGNWIRSKAEHLKADKFGFNPEVVALICDSEEPICEVGISYYARSKSQGKKIRFIDGIQAIYEIIKYNLL